MIWFPSFEPDTEDRMTTQMGALRWVLVAAADGDQMWHLSFDGLTTAYSHFDDRLGSASAYRALEDAVFLDPHPRCLDCRRYVARLVGIEQ